MSRAANATVTLKFVSVARSKPKPHQLVLVRRIVPDFNEYLYALATWEKRNDGSFWQEETLDKISWLVQEWAALPEKPK